MNTVEAARKWVEGWSRAWAAHDPDVVGLVAEQRDYWAMQEGPRVPGPGWGR